MLDQELRDTKALIDRGETLTAKARIVAYLKDHPQSADAWWLMSLLADDSSDKLLVLQQALSLDPRHYEAAHDLRRLREVIKPPGTALPARSPAPPPTPTQTKPPSHLAIKPLEPKAPAKTAAPAPPKAEPRATAEEMSAVMQEAVRAYVTKGWSVTRQDATKIVLEKRSGIGWTWAILAATLIPVAGLILFFANFIMRRHYQVELIRVPNQARVQAAGKQITRTTLDAAAIRAGLVPMPQPPGWTTALLGGSLFTGVVCCALPVGLLVWAGSVLDDAKYTKGQSVYLSAPTDEGVFCVQIYAAAGDETPLMQRRSGLAVVVDDSTEVSRGTETTWWYKVRTGDTPLGWVPENNLTRDRPATVSPGLCP